MNVQLIEFRVGIQYKFDNIGGDYAILVNVKMQFAVGRARSPTGPTELLAIVTFLKSDRLLFWPEPVAQKQLLAIGLKPFYTCGDTKPANTIIISLKQMHN